jgi:PrcB C-terminal
MPSRLLHSSASWLFCLIGLGACAVATSDTPVALQESALTPGQSLSFSELVDPQGVGDAANRAAHVLITRAAQYQRLFGHAAPSGVDFRREALVFYSAGSEPTGGFAASLLAITYAGGQLYVTTQLESPSPDCIVTEMITHPNVLVRLNVPRFVFGTRWRSQDSVRECADTQSCGGITGKQCPGNGQCSDDPSDSCDPANGGADCGGLCACGPQTELCMRGSVFDNSPKVCACVPDPTQDPCAAVSCKEGTHCSAADGGAQCLPDSVSCGGFIGKGCPGSGQCVDAPNDGCDPKQGGADCSGICTCPTLYCPQGATFNGSPEVCACVPAAPQDPCAGLKCAPGSVCSAADGGGVCVSDGGLGCGKNTCAAGSVCCNSSCGICTTPDMACIQIACL